MPSHLKGIAEAVKQRQLKEFSIKQLNDLATTLDDMAVNGSIGDMLTKATGNVIDGTILGGALGKAAKLGKLGQLASTTLGGSIIAEVLNALDVGIFSSLANELVELDKLGYKEYADKIRAEIESRIAKDLGEDPKKGLSDVSNLKAKISGKYGLTVEAVLSGERLPDTSVDLAGAKRQVNFPGKNQDDRDMARPDRGPGSYDRDGNLQGKGGKSTIDPIVLDLNGDGKVDLVSYEQSHSDIDVLGTGFKHHAGWVGPNDGLLAIDLDGDGKINKTLEWAFANQTTNIEGDTDLEALASLYDSNKDGVLDAKDADWAKFPASGRPHPCPERRYHKKEECAQAWVLSLERFKACTPHA